MRCPAQVISKMYVPFYFFRMTNKTHYNYIWFPKFGDFLLGEITNNKDSITNNKVINLTRDVTKCEILYSQTWERKFLWFFVFRIWFHANFFSPNEIKNGKIYIVFLYSKLQILKHLRIYLCTELFSSPIFCILYLQIFKKSKNF